jgi:hypothetical protein
MSEPNSDSGLDEVIAEFMREYDAAGDKAAVIERYRQTHPQLGAAFADYASGRSLIHEAATSPEPPPHHLQAGEIIDGFRIIRFVAHGGMGEIYEAEQIRLSKRRVALKVIRRGKALPEARARFLREQEVLAKLHQTNIVPVFAAGERGELQYFAMQYIDGATLAHVVQFLRRRDSKSGSTEGLDKLVKKAASAESDPGAPTASAAAPQPAPEAPPAPPVLTDEYLRSVATSLADVADALDAAHKANVLHRDIKPSNLMVEKSGKCWVIDFGLAGLVGQASARRGDETPILSGSQPQDRNRAATNIDQSIDPALTGTGSALGTCAYMAPEQFAGNSDHRSDVWALGVTLYELLALRRPFDGPTREDFERQVAARPPGLRTLARNVPRDLEAPTTRSARQFARYLPKLLAKARSAGLDTTQLPTAGQILKAIKNPDYWSGVGDVAIQILGVDPFAQN